MTQVTVTSVDDSLRQRGIANGSIPKTPIRDKIKDLALLAAGVAATVGVVVVGYNVGVNTFQETITSNIIGHAQNIVGMKTGINRVVAAETVANQLTSRTIAWDAIEMTNQEAFLLRESYEKATKLAADRMLTAYSNPAIPSFASPDRTGFLPQDLQAELKMLPLSKQRKFIENAEQQASIVAAQASYLAVGMAQKISQTFDMATMSPNQRDKFTDAIAARAVSQSIREMAATDILALTGHDKPATAADALKDSYRNLVAPQRPKA